MDKVFKTYRATVKEVNAEEGTIDLMIPISSNQVDRDGEIIDPIAFRKTIPKFMKHPVLVASHDYRNLTNQIGEWTKLKVEDNGFSGKPKYYINAGNEQADWAYFLASKGVAAFSVGFIPKVWDDGDGEKAPRRTYKEVELLEISQVIIPSNREAIQSMRSKSVDDPVITELCDEVERELPEETPREYAKRRWVDEPRKKAGLPPIEEELTSEEKEIIFKPEETDDFIRIPVRTCEVTATIDISKKEGISALYCGKEKKVRTYLFRKDKEWTLEKAKAWVKEHDGKGVSSEEEGITVKEDNPNPKPVSQSQIVDEIDYLKSLIEKVGVAEATLKSLNDSIGGYLKKMNMGKMQEMHDMMQSCEGMAKKAKKMSEDMMAEEEDMDDEDMEDMDEERSLGSDIPVNNKSDDILREIQTTKLGGK